MPKELIRLIHDYFSNLSWSSNTSFVSRGSLGVLLSPRKAQAPFHKGPPKLKSIAQLEEELAAMGREEVDIEKYMLESEWNLPYNQRVDSPKINS